MQQFFTLRDAAAELNLSTHALYQRLWRANLDTRQMDAALVLRLKDAVRLPRVAEELAIPYPHARALIRAGTLDGFTFAGFWYVPRSEVERVKRSTFQQSDSGVHA